MSVQYSVTGIKDLIAGKLQRRYGCDPGEATKQQLYRSTALVVQHLLADLRHASAEAAELNEVKQVYYMSVEFLLGRSLKNHLYNLGLTHAFSEAVRALGGNLEELFELEPDAGLGNGGLGRLAACYMDSMSALSLPAQGYSIRYEFGIFRQQLDDGWQTELPDAWLGNADVWLVPRTDEAVEVHFGGTVSEEWTAQGLKANHTGYETVLAIPHDMLISGYGGERVNLLRLWGAKSPTELDMSLFGRGEYLKAVEQNARAETISRVLYPADEHWEGKLLRLKQQYFMVAASTRDIISKHLNRYGTLDSLPDKVAIHINDTHPTMVIPELMRLLMDEHGYEWDRAWSLVTETCAYTNHTVMSEALELWPISLFSETLPRIFSIIERINALFCDDLKARFGADDERVGRMAMLGTWEVRMANLCLVGCHSVNGVSRLHSDILTSSAFRDFADMVPGKFRNVTNGIAHRRWLCQANPDLSRLIEDLIGPGFKSDPEQLAGLERYRDDSSVLQGLAEIRRRNKEHLVAYIERSNGVRVDASSIFDVQVKRLHEYKRQLLNVLHILHLYDSILDNPSASLHPRTFIFGAKASPGYFMAKQIIRLIDHVADMVNSTPIARDKLKVIFIEDYNVTKAELIVPAADISEQISVAGKEASGTGNMKLMINGAVTVGTLDGANIEILEAAGAENTVIFGMTADQVENLWRSGYNPRWHYESNPRVKRVVDMLRRDIGGASFSDIADYLLDGRGGHADPYMCLADFESYLGAQAEAQAAYLDPIRWNRMSLANIAGAGRFSADRAVHEYAEGIWGIRPVPSGLGVGGAGLATG